MLLVPGGGLILSGGAHCLLTLTACLFRFGGLPSLSRCHSSNQEASTLLTCISTQVSGANTADDRWPVFTQERIKMFYFIFLLITSQRQQFPQQQEDRTLSKWTLDIYQNVKYSELPSLVWPGMLGCLDCSWLWDFSLL